MFFQNEEDLESKVGKALEAFFAQFGNMDESSVVVLEEFFRELMDGEK